MVAETVLGFVFVFLIHNLGIIQTVDSRNLARSAYYRFNLGDSALATAKAV